MTSLLAQTSSIDPAFMGALVIALIALTGWFFQYKKDRREEAALIEPKANPPLHRQFVTRTEFDRHVTDMGTRLDKIEAAGEARVIRIYDKIDDQTDRIINAVLNRPSAPRR